MGGNFGPGVGIKFAPFRQVSAVTYAFLVGYFKKYPASSSSLSDEGAFLMKMPISGTSLSDICESFTVTLTSDTSLIQVLTSPTIIVPSPITNHFSILSSSLFWGFNV
jgi:hypothetical protein